ncbi:MAG: hypothetical protein ACM3MG_08400 [Bacillota bacterium]
MTKNSFFIFVIFLVIGFSIWFSHFGKDIKKTQDLVVEQQEKTQQVLRRRTTSINENNSPSLKHTAEKDRLRQDIQALSVQLEAETQKLSSLQSRLENLRQQLRSKTDPNYGYQISSLSDEIQDLSDSLRIYQWSEGDLDRKVNMALQEQSAELRLAVQQMEQNIIRQEQEIKANQDELSFWIYNNGDMTQKDQRIQYLENALLNQSQELNDMKMQRAQILSNSLEQSKSIQTEASVTASAINEDRYAIQEQMAALRGEIKRLQYLQNQASASKFSLMTQVQQTEKNSQEQQETIKTIEDLIRQKQGELKKME